MKNNLTMACSAVFMLALLLANASAQMYINPLDDKTGWGGPGGPAGSLSSWTIDNTVVAPGSTASWKVAGNFSGGTYIDLYTENLGVYDFSTNTFSIWYQSSVTNVPVLWRLGTVSGPVYEVGMTATTPDTWQQFTFNANQFTGTLENLTNVNLIQLRIAGDNIAPGSANFYLDQMNIVPEPSTFALLGISAFGTAGLAWRKRQRRAGR